MRFRIALLVVAVLLGAYFLIGARRAPGQHGASLPDDPVMVVVVKSHDDIAAVRAVVDPERIVANSLDGFVVREGRVVVASVESAGPLLAVAGWSEAKLEIVKLAARPVPVGSLGSGTGAGGGLAGLHAKPTLTLDEALLALRLIE